MKLPPVPLLLGAGALLAGREVWRRREALDLRGQVIIVTGGSRGLGFAMARELAGRGARVAICARDPEALARARANLERLSSPADVLAATCDVSDQDQVDAFVQQVFARFGRMDGLINNAGVIMVGPLETQTVADFQTCLDVMFWGVVYPTLAVLPHMRQRGSGRIVNVTSIGGKVAVPHLASYSAAKFAAVGFSEGLRAELAKDGISVTTVVPGLMRTGSHLNAYFKGHHHAEFSLFSLVGTLPFTSADGEDAAHAIVEAMRRGDAEVILTWQANLMARVHGLLPGLTSNLLGLVNRVLPGDGGIGTAVASGKESHTPISESPLTALGQDAARRLNQLG